MLSDDKAPVMLTRRTLHDGVYLNLRESLMAGEFAPGTRLTAREVAEKMGTSVMPVREAFRQLTAQRALEPLSTGATRVPILDAGNIADIMELRQEVEGLAVRRAATRITAAQCHAASTANDEMLMAIRRRNPRDEAKANEHFHFCIYRAAASDELLHFIQHLWVRIGPCLFALLREERAEGRKPNRFPAAHHEALLEAMRRHDPEKAAAALRADLTAAASVLAQTSHNQESTTRAESVRPTPQSRLRLRGRRRKG
jgi:DNA-binding GntR family transcriptional regulator